VRSLPKVIKALTVIGTIAMLLVAGGIFIHNSHFVHDLVHSIPFLLGDLLIGFIVGAVAVGVMMIVEKVRH
jgi:hypothetical protein